LLAVALSTRGADMPVSLLGVVWCVCSAVLLWCHPYASVHLSSGRLVRSGLTLVISAAILLVAAFALVCVSALRHWRSSLPTSVSLGSEPEAALLVSMGLVGCHLLLVAGDAGSLYAGIEMVTLIGSLLCGLPFGCALSLEAAVKDVLAGAFASGVWLLGLLTSTLTPCAELPFLLCSLACHKRPHRARPSSVCQRQHLMVDAAA